MRVAHLGPRGTYTEQAAVQFDAAAELLPRASVPAAIETVLAGEADVAVCAMENSIEGTASIETLDLLIGADFPLRICGETVVQIQHMLVGAPGLDLTTVERVYSHPSALLQCRRTLARLAPRAQPAAALSTAGAIEGAINEPGSVAIGNERSALLYGATIYARDIGDESGNETRFVVLGRSAAARTGDDKTSLAFTTQHDRPGSLVEVLGMFARRGLNMTRIESRPTRQRLGTYVFFVDVQGHTEDPAMVEVLAEAAGVTDWLRVLGSYPRWKSRD
ncbi:MAG: prephenate dehydratase [Chloroflexi bacterium]|nr:prephenate dehydratase [Chloroflexota bacterium]MDA1240993.1 prephenate dehydratase [Chloroflexota bacterium]